MGEGDNKKGWERKGENLARRNIGREKERQRQRKGEENSREKEEVSEFKKK